jgi:hypothetical protein
MADEADNAPEGPGYSFRPSLLGAPWEFRLTPAALAWSVGRRSGTTPYTDITKVQLAFRPGTMQGAFVATVRAARTPQITIKSTSWKSMVEVERQDAPYRDFILALHRRLLESGATPQYVRGVHPAIYWPGLAVIGTMMLGFVVLIVRAVQTAAWAGGAFILAFLFLSIWQLGGYFRSNRPGSYRPDAVPRDVLP